MAATIPQQNHHPQIADPSNGLINHTYIPRPDGTVVIGGVVYAPQPGSATVTAPAATPPPVIASATVTAEPCATTPAVGPAPTQVHFTPPGGPSVPVEPVNYNVPCPFSYAMPSAMPYYICEEV
jgi:hypothetical protein